MTLETTEFLTETQLWNAIARQFGVALPLPAGQVVLAPSDPPGADSPCIAVAVGPDIALTVALEAFPFGRLAGVDLTMADVIGLPNALAEGLILGAFEALRLGLPPAIAQHVVLPDQLGAPERTMWLSAQVDLGSGAVASCRVGGRQQDFVQILARLFPGAAGRLPPLPAALLTGLSTEVALCSGEAVLPLAAVAELEPGDVILATLHADRRSFMSGHSQVVIGAGAMTEDGGIAPSGWNVKEIRMTGDQPDAGSGAISLEDVPLTLRFVTENQRLTLAELQGLAAGALVPFDVAQLAAGVPVRIQANGMTIGEGHIVQIDDSFAVRIARMVPKGS